MCPTCNRPFSGRTDKKYCSDQCRYIANNKRKHANEHLILDVNKILRRNRAILRKLCPIGKATVRREVLDALGFNVTIFSSIFVSSGKQIYYICYYYAFTPIKDHQVEKVLIVTKQDYMNSWDPWKYVKQNS
jgi:predicted nucleic acid-binding Zn ribbon protein